MCIKAAYVTIRTYDSGESVESVQPQKFASLGSLLWRLLPLHPCSLLIQLKVPAVGTTRALSLHHCRFELAAVRNQ